MNRPSLALALALTGCANQPTKDFDACQNEALSLGEQFDCDVESPYGNAGDYTEECNTLLEAFQTAAMELCLYDRTGLWSECELQENEEGISFECDVTTEE